MELNETTTAVPETEPAALLEVLAAAQHQGDDEEDDAELGCDSLEQWVTEILAPTYPRRITTQFRWCAQWWQHTEAIVRLEALWRSWEALRLDPRLGMATWHRDYLDTQLAVLTGPAGPFADCQPDRHFAPDEPTLRVEPTPPGWWHAGNHTPTGGGHE